jgi:hypothetical protein
MTISPKYPSKRNDQAAREQKRIRILDSVLTVLFLGSAILVIWGIEIYRKTVIEPKHLLIVVMIATAMTSLILLAFTKNYLNAFWTIFIASVIGGGTSFFLTLFLNRELIRKEIVSEYFEIQDTGNMAKGLRSKCGPPYVVVNFHGREKQMVFPCRYETSIHTFKKIKLDHYEGFFGFVVIMNQELIEW